MSLSLTYTFIPKRSYIFFPPNRRRQNSRRNLVDVRDDLHDADGYKMRARFPRVESTAWIRIERCKRRDFFETRSPEERSWERGAKFSREEGAIAQKRYSKLALYYYEFDVSVPFCSSEYVLRRGGKRKFARSATVSFKNSSFTSGIFTREN